MVCVPVVCVRYVCGVCVVYVKRPACIVGPQVLWTHMYSRPCVCVEHRDDCFTNMSCLVGDRKPSSAFLYQT